MLARGRGTPNMALRGADEDLRLKPLFGKLVRLEVRASDFSIREADAAEADEYWQARAPKGPKLEPERELSVRGRGLARQRELFGYLQRRLEGGRHRRAVPRQRAQLLLSELCVAVVRATAGVRDSVLALPRPFPDQRCRGAPVPTRARSGVSRRPGRARPTAWRACAS